MCPVSDVLLSSPVVALKSPQPGRSVRLNFLCDAGHGWLSVQRNLLFQFPTVALRVSSYSYQRNDRVYLEEDCDAELLMAALAQHGYNMQFTSKHSDRRSPIRSYDRFLLSFDEKALLDSVP